MIDAEAKKIIAQLNKKFGEGTVVLGEAIRNDLIERKTSGSLALDVILGGGWPTNQWHEIEALEDGTVFCNVFSNSTNSSY